MAPAARLRPPPGRGESPLPATARHRQGPLVNFASGAAASVLATCATQPFDVLRTRAMLQLVTAKQPSLAVLGA